MIKSNLKFLLLKNNMKLNELAEKTGIDYWYLSRLQNNKVKDLNLDKWKKLATALNCNFKDLWLDDEDNFELGEKKIKNIA